MGHPLAGAGGITMLARHACHPIYRLPSARRLRALRSDGPKIYYYTQEVAKKPVIVTLFVLWLPLFPGSASVLPLGTFSLPEVPLLSTTSLTIHISRL